MITASVMKGLNTDRQIALVTASVAIYITSGGQDIIRSFILHTNIKQKFRLIQLNECNLSSKGDMGRCNTLVRGADQ